ncbi:S8 family peptidase, partial [Streptomyces sp. Vc714c-19]|nr:S8 family peptidase [Streptomyces sp. Vc714c-19]
SSDEDDAQSSFSNYGDIVDIYAPGSSPGRRRRSAPRTLNQDTLPRRPVTPAAGPPPAAAAPPGR